MGEPCSNKARREYGCSMGAAAAATETHWSMHPLVGFSDVHAMCACGSPT